MPDSEQMAIAGTLFGAGVVVFLILAINDRQKRKLEEKASKARTRQNPNSINRQTYFIIVFFLLLTLPVVLLSFAQNRGGAGWANWGWKVASAMFQFLNIATLLIILFGLLIWYVARRQNRDFVRIEQLALNGEIEAAIRHLHGILERNGEDISNTGNRKALNYLAALEGMNGRWDHALQMIQRLELDFRSEMLFLANKALVLWKLGHLSNAEACFREQIRLAPYDDIPWCALGLFLAESNRIIEAKEALQQAEQKYDERTKQIIIGWPPDNRVLEILRGVIRESSPSGSDGSVPIMPKINEAIRVMLISNASGMALIQWKPKPRDSLGSATQLDDDPDQPKKGKVEH